MKRFTKKNEDGTWKLEGWEWKTLSDLLPKNIWEFLYGALWKLKDYEDTGLMPSEIETFSDMCDLEDENSVCKRMVNKVANLSAEVETLDTVSDWTLTSKRLPEEHREVLAAIQTPHGGIFVYGLTFQRGGRWAARTGDKYDAMPEGYRVIMWRDDFEEVIQ